MRTNILTNYTTNSIDFNRLKQNIEQTPKVDLNSINLKESTLFKSLTQKVNHNIETKIDSIPVITKYKVEEKSFEFGDVESFHNLNNDPNINKINWLSNCVNHENVIENTTIALKHSSDYQLSFVKEMLAKFHNKELICEETLYKYIGNTFTYTCLNINPECLDEVIQVFWDSYSTIDYNQCINNNIQLQITCVDEIEENNLKSIQEIDKIKEDNSTKLKSFLVQHRKKLVLSGGLLIGSTLLAKVGVSAFPIMIAKQCAGYIPYVHGLLPSNEEILRLPSTTETPRARDVYDQTVKLVFNILKQINTKFKE